MYDKFFGNFLLNQGVLTAEQVKNVLDLMDRTKVRVGTMAIKRGLLTGDQVTEIVHLQKQKDMRFGEIAVDLGYLKKEQIEELLNIQSEESTLQFGQAAVDLDYLSYGKLEAEMKEFEGEAGLSADQLNALKENNIDKIVDNFLDLGMLNNYYVSLFLRNLVRFIDRNIWIDKGIEEGFYVTTQKMLLDGKAMITGIAVDKETRNKIAKRYAKIDTDEEDLINAAVEEFLNLHNGLFSVSMSNLGVAAKLEPPGFYEDYSWDNQDGMITQDSKTNIIGIGTGAGHINLVLQEK